MSKPPSDREHVQLLFQVKKGTVTAEIRGPRIGWNWRVVRYFRWKTDPRQPGTWERVLPDRAVDQIYLDHCVRAVRAWLKEDEARHRAPSLED